MPFSKILAVLILLPFGALLTSCADSPRMTKKMLVIGMDGLDPKLLKKWMDSGDLPNFKKLAEEGSFSDLQTTNPPQSPVAWSCFINGNDPGHHDVFDFIARDPETYTPEISMTETIKKENKSPKDWDDLKKMFFGLAAPTIKSRRKGASFWDLLSKEKIKSVILRCPVTFPAEPLHGRLISGMGTPDIKGTQGIFSYWTTKKEDEKQIQGRVIKLKLSDNVATSVITGPKVKVGNELKEAEVPFRAVMGDKKITLEVQGQTLEIEEETWSPWVRVKFKLGFLKSISGTMRFYLHSVYPHFALYGSAVNIDPKAPVFKISHPSGYAKDVYEDIGFYTTQGMPYDTWALNERRLTEEGFLTQAYSILDENIALMNVELEKFDSGLLFSYFGITDLVSHMFWRYTDPEHPTYVETDKDHLRFAIRNVYKRMDEELGKIRSKIDSDTLLFVLSDHGFTTFRRAANINRWLIEKNFMVTKDGEKVSGEFFENVDWEKTSAYSIGFGGIYINQFKREGEGTIYKGAESDKVREDLITALKAWRDDNGALLIKDVYKKEDLYSGDFQDNGPDLFIGFADGYRASWQTALGAAPKHLVEFNRKAWSGDHLCDPSLVPGVLLSNKAITASKPGLLDIAPTILDYFDVKTTASFKGKSLF